MKDLLKLIESLSLEELRELNKELEKEEDYEVCPDCRGEGYFVDYDVEYVTSDMASDAGDLSLAGYSIQVPIQVPCERCEGTGMIKKEKLEEKWSSKKDVPANLKSLSLSQANYWAKVYDAVKEEGNDESSAAKIAWMQTKKKYKIK